jgi:hypothetical protein
MCGRLAAPLCAALLAATVVQAQETINHASVSGRITDTQGGVIAGAQVIARHAGTNVKTEAMTDVDGRFRLPYLRVGPHEVTVHRDGFADDRRSLMLSLASAFDLSITLAVAGVDTQVTVTGEGAALETARSQIAGTLAQAEVQACR